MSLFDASMATANADILAVMGDSITYTPAVGSPYLFTAIVDLSERARLVEAGSAGTAWALLSAFTSPPKSGDTVTINSVAYKVSVDPTHKLDGSGGATPANDGVTLVLRRK